jgi:integrase
MDEGRKNRDFSKGPVWNPERNRWLVEVRYPDGSRLRKRLRREREALRIWSAEQTKIENGTWHEQAPKTVTFETALKQYREYSRVQNRSHDSYVEPALSVWEAHIKAKTLLAKITPALIEDVKLRRAQDVARSTVDKDLAVLKAFFNWCVARNLAASNPVRRVKLFHEDNSRLRYLSREEYDRLLEAARTIETSPYLEEKIIMAVHTGLRRGSLFNLRWDQIDFANRVVRIPRTKSGRPLSLPMNETTISTLQTLHAAGDLTSPYVFPHTAGPKAGEPVRDIKNGFHRALELAEIRDFTWHDLRHTFAS